MCFFKLSLSALIFGSFLAQTSLASPPLSAPEPSDKVEEIV